jgi:predicted ATP-binding protein involved in virulence
MQYLKRIKIKDLRHLKNLIINLESDDLKHLIITGRNGSGKTSFLDAIYNVLKYPFNVVKDSIFNSNQLELEFYENTIINLKGEFIFAYLKDYRKLELAKSNGPNKNVKETDDRTYLLIQYLVNMKTDSLFAKQEGNVEESEKIDKWFLLFENFLKKIFEDEHLKLIFDYKKYDFIINLSDGKNFNLKDSSAGYAAVLKIVTEIMVMMGLDKVDYDKPGIVLIDELETHLHVSLQKNVLPMLISFFPNIQFIITTHSPFIINSCENCIIYDLERAIQISDLSAYSYESIVENYFDVDKYSNEIKDKIERYENLISKDNLSDDEQKEKDELRFYIEGLIGDELVIKIKDLKLNRLMKRKREKVD